MKALKAFFLSRLLTEKFLLTGFLLIIALWWFSHVARRISLLGVDFRNTTMILAAQKKSLDGRANTERKVKAALSQLDPSRTLDSARLQGDLSTLATGLPAGTSIEAPRDEPADQFIKHSVQFSVRKVDWSTLQQFYVALSKRAPYISIEECSISAERTDPNQLDATMLISSVEIAK
ncbi:MAG TPA: hypothetical protein VGP21_07525 [Opitutaceae bacterium]|jgi:hypothetical protein|nr:hypothetical protein [Opitutaceae bacterium]